jgi:hypothetical protein
VGSFTSWIDVNHKDLKIMLETLSRKEWGQDRDWPGTKVGPDGGQSRSALSNAAPAGAMAPAIYFSGALRKHI